MIIAINQKKVYVMGIEMIRADMVTDTEPNPIPATTDDIIGVKQGVRLSAGSTLFCGDTGATWMLTSFEGDWVETTSSNDGGSSGEK